MDRALAVALFCWQHRMPHWGGILPGCGCSFWPSFPTEAESVSISAFIFNSWQSVGKEASGWPPKIYGRSFFVWVAIFEVLSEKNVCFFFFLEEFSIKIPPFFFFFFNSSKILCCYLCCSGGRDRKRPWLVFWRRLFCHMVITFWVGDILHCFLRQVISW